MLPGPRPRRRRSTAGRCGRSAVRADRSAVAGRPSRSCPQPGPARPGLRGRRSGWCSRSSAPLLSSAPAWDSWYSIMPSMGVPSRLGRYAVRRRLGSGGFATVWLAHDEQLDAEVAIKVLADNWGHDDSVRRRFLEEGRFLRRVESEHVVQVHDVGELEDGRPFLVLTYADRGTLADRLKEGPLELPEAVDVV